MSTEPFPGTFDLGGDLTVRRLGYGAMQLPGPGVWGPPRDHDEAIRVLRRAVELGVTFIDTADSYGPYVAEELIAEALHPYPRAWSSRPRPGSPARPGTVGPSQWQPVGRPEYLRQQREVSLRRLGAGAHRPVPAAPHRPEGAARGPARRARSGCRTRARSGTSGCPRSRSTQLRRRSRSRRRFGAEPYNLTDRAAEPVLEHCARQGIAFIPWFPLATGALAARWRAAGRAGRQARRDAGAAGAGLAARALTGDAADPRHLIGAAPRGQHARR